MEASYDKRGLEQVTLKKDIDQYKRITLGLMGFHIVFLLAGIFLRIPYIIVVNCISVSFYVIMFFLFSKCKKRSNIIVYAHSLIYEVMFHIVCCTLFFGWEMGFQYWLFSLLCTYLFPYIVPDRSEKDRKRLAFICTFLILGEFIALYLITHYFEFPFHGNVNKTIRTLTVIMNGCLGFGAITIFTMIYTRQMEFKYALLHNVADFDQLTGLGNRYYMNDILVTLEKERKNDEKYSVAMLDIDFFKKVNDNYGHDKGDIVLREIGSILTDNSSDKISVGRWGGEEFLIIAASTINYSDFVELLEKLRVEIKRTDFVFNGEIVNVTVSIGVAQYEDGKDIPEVIKMADSNLYRAKESGRDRIVSK